MIVVVMMIVLAILGIQIQLSCEKQNGGGVNQNSQFKNSTFLKEILCSFKLHLKKGFSLRQKKVVGVLTKHVL